MEAAVETAKAPRVGSIFVGDVEQLQYTVAPWQLRMNQLSSGSLQASFSFTQMDNVLLTRERWTKQISGIGLSPPGFIAFAADCAGPLLSWCGSTLSANRLVCAFDGQEIDFLTAENEERWVMLLPIKLLETYLGAEPATFISTDTRSLLGDPQLISQLTSQVLHTMTVRDELRAITENCLANHPPIRYAVSHRRPVCV